jgi:hypothetical protein
MKKKKHYLNHDEVKNIVENVKSLPFKIEDTKFALFEKDLKAYEELKTKSE